MVSLIKEELESDDLTGDLQWVAEHIVGICTRAGMLPPLNPKKSHLDMNHGTNIKCSWEPENEEN
jgi:hypothetical protein